MNPFGNMSDRELELLVRFIAKASPPPILYRYRRASEWAIKELQAPEVHIASIDDMNDPFEYRAPLSIDIEKLRVSMFAYAREQLGMDHDAAQEEAEFVNQFGVTYLQESIEALRSASGLICCSSNPRSNRMWAYYGDSQKGICVGYSTDFSPFCFSRRVDYADPVSSIDLLDTLKQEPTLLSDQVSCRKGKEWDFEQEFRVPVGPIAQGKTRLLPVRPKPLWRSVLGQKSAWISNRRSLRRPACFLSIRASFRWGAITKSFSSRKPRFQSHEVGGLQEMVQTGFLESLQKRHVSHSHSPDRH